MGYEFYADPNIVKYIKVNRLRYVVRVDNERVPLKMLNGHPDGKTPSDLKNLGVSHWRKLALNRSFGKACWRRTKPRDGCVVRISMCRHFKIKKIT